MSLFLSSTLFSLSLSLENGTTFSGSQDNGTTFSVTYKPYGTIVSVWDGSGDNNITVEYEAFSIWDIAKAEYLARSVLSSITLSDRKVEKLLKNLSSVNNYSVDRVIHFSHSKQIARTLYTAE